MGMGQNLLIMWYKGWPSTLRFTGGTGFWPTSRCFSLFFPSMSSPQGPSPKSLVGKKHLPTRESTGPKGVQKPPSWGIFWQPHHRIWWQKKTYVWHMSPRCSRVFRRQKSIEPYYWSNFACRNPSMSQGPWPFPALSTQDRDGNISYREFVPFTFDLLQKMASSGAPRAMEELTSGWMLMVRINILYHNIPRLVNYYNLPRWLISSLIMNSLTMLHSIQ